MRTLITGSRHYRLSDDDIAWMGMFSMSQVIFPSVGNNISIGARRMAGQRGLQTREVANPIGLPFQLDVKPMSDYCDRLIVFRNGGYDFWDIIHVAERQGVRVNVMGE